MSGRWASALAMLALCGCRPQAHAPVAAAPIQAPRAGEASPAIETHAGSSAGAANHGELVPADLSAQATYLLPGAFSPDVRLGQLEQRFGKANVRVGDVPGAEGETARGAILFPDDPMRRAYLYFQNQEELSGLQLVRVLDERSRWHLVDGVRIGMPLSELVARNGKPIRFYGFDWDYGGAITDWNGGKLKPAEDRDAISLGIRLGRAEDAPDTAYPSGEGEYSSDDRRYPQLGSIAIVAEISASFPGEDDL